MQTDGSITRVSQEVGGRHKMESYGETVRRTLEIPDVPLIIATDFCGRRVYVVVEQTEEYAGMCFHTCPPVGLHSFLVREVASTDVFGETAPEGLSPDSKILLCGTNGRIKMSTRRMVRAFIERWAECLSQNWLRGFSLRHRF
jgi:hypothetical protein